MAPVSHCLSITHTKSVPTPKYPQHHRVWVTRSLCPDDARQRRPDDARQRLPGHAEQLQTGTSSPSDSVTTRNNSHQPAQATEAESYFTSQHQTTGDQKRSINHKNSACDPESALAGGEAEAGGDLRKGPSQAPGRKRKAQI